MSVSAPIVPSGSDLRVRPVDASEISSPANPASIDATVRAQETRGGDTRGDLVIARGGKVDSGKVAALRTEIENAYDMNGNDLAAKVGALNIAERNELLRTLSTSGIGQLTFEVAQARTGNPKAYAQLQHDLLSGQPPAQIQRILNAALAWDTPGNPVGQNMAQGLVHDFAAHIAANGTKGQKLGLIDNLTDPAGQGLAARRGTAAEAVGELFKGLRGDPAAITSALAMMSQGDKAAVARETLRSDDAAGIAQVLRYSALGTNEAQRTQMAEQFVPQAHLVQGDKREALTNGVTLNLRQQINGAGRQFGISPEAIGAILYQELATRDPSDAVQDRLAAEIANTPVGSPERQAAIERANRDGNVSPNPASRKNIARETTLGYSQLSVEGVVKLFGGEWSKDSRSFTPTSARNYVPPGVMSQQQFFTDPVGNAMKLLTNPEMAPMLVGAWSARVIDIRRGNARNEEIALIPANANATAQQRQAREDLQFRYLTGSYSTGGNIESLAGQPWGSPLGLGGQDTDRTRTPSRFPPGQLAPGEQAANSRRALIEQLLR